MPAKGSDDLFRLIKSLSPAEKGYFKKFADRYSFSEKDNNYLRLFEAIDAQETYDETKLAKEPFVNQLPRQKNYLQNLVLRSLQLYDAEVMPIIEIENNIQQVRALVRRGQYDMCRKLLLKAKKEAIKYECFLEALKLAQLEDYLNKESGMDKTYETESLSYIERYKLIEQEENNEKMLELEQQVVMFSRSNYSKNASLKNKLLTGNPPLLSRKAKLTFYNALAIYNNFTKNYEKQYFYSKEYLKLKKADLLIFKRLYILFPAYANFCFACFANKRYKEANEIANEILIGRVENNQQEEFRQKLHRLLKTFLFIATGKFEEGSAFVKDAVKNQHPNGFYINPRMDCEILMNINLITFGSGEYKNCLKYLDTLLSAQTKENATFIYYQAVLMNVLTHYELGNKETVEHLIISARRTFRNNNKLTPLEEIMLTFLKKYTTNEPTNILVTKTIESLKKVAGEENYHSIASIYSFCLSWLESKLHNKTLPEIIKEKAKKESGKNYWK